MSQEKENRQHENAQSVQEGQQPHKRRVRYKGRYPKKFEEKYKEREPLADRPGTRYNAGRSEQEGTHVCF